MRRSSKKTPLHGILLGLAILIASGLSGHVRAAEWFVAPIGSSTRPAPSGTETDPFASVAAALNSGKVKGGDTILLKDGSHGFLTISNRIFDTPVTIMSQNGRRAHLSGILFSNGSRNIWVRRLSVWPDDPSIGGDIIHSHPDTSDIRVQLLTIRGAKDGGKFMSWTAAMWSQRRYNAVQLRGDRSRVGSNLIMGVNIGITVSGSDSVVANNQIDGFAGDGLRGLGDNNAFRGNRLTNCIKINDNHDDGFQSWAGPSGRVKGLVLDRNTIIEWNGDPNHPLRCSLQGIGLFDGFYDDLVVTNNLVSVTAYHGISVYGARNAKILNNTVVHNRNQALGFPWVGIFNHKNGTLPSDVLVANNVAMKLSGTSDAGRRVAFRSNSVIGAPGVVFVNPFAFDYRPKASSGYIDTADSASAPVLDITKYPRSTDGAPDRGAFEIRPDLAAPATAMAAEDEDASDDGASEDAAEEIDTTGAKRIRVRGNN